MDLTFHYGNAFHIVTPPEVKTELSLYLYLSFSRTALVAAINHATKIRTESCPDVWAHHKAIWFPFVIYPATTEVLLLSHVYRRLRIFLENGTNRL